VGSVRGRTYGRGADIALGHFGRSSMSSFLGCVICFFGVAILFELVGGGQLRGCEG
jgi:hypothetical protein